jgi:hypothetical protein
MDILIIPGFITCSCFEIKINVIETLIYPRMKRTVAQRTFFYVSKVSYFKRYNFILLCLKVKIHKDMYMLLTNAFLGNVRLCLMIFEMNFILNDKVITNFSNI